VNNGLDGDRYWSYITAEVASTSGRLLKWASTKFTERTDLYDDDIISSVMLCVPVFLTAARSEWTFGKAESAEQEVSDRSCLVVF
jgi:hypothetical protein